MNVTTISFMRCSGLSSGARRWVLGLLLWGLGLGLAGGADISGTYGARGVKVAGAVGDGAAEISLPALLQLEFNAELGLARHASSDVVVIEEGRHWVEVRVLDREGEQTWRTHWNEGEGFERAGAIRQLSIASPRRGEAAIVFLFETIEDGRLLRLEVVRMVATNFGPVPESMGTFIFYRAP